MEKTFTIGEIARLLGLGSDAVRFYEKKGLVHPSVNPDNKYRIYGMQNILELLDVIYYRHLDLSVADIQTITQNSSKEVMQELIRHKKEETESRIRYEQALLKKLSYVSDLFDNVAANRNICSLRMFPESVVLFESQETSDFFTQQIQHFSTDQFVLCSLFKQFHVQEELNEVKSFITLEKQIMKELKMDVHPDAVIYPAQECVFSLIKMEGHAIRLADAAPLLAYAKEHGYESEPILYVREIPLTLYSDEENYYAELYIPISK